jgi:hypothetical protein
MEILGNRIELAEQFSRAGYRPELAEIARHEYKAGREGCNIETIARADGQPFWIDLYFNFYHGGQIAVRGLCATLTKQERWMEFQGLPDAREVHRQLLERQQKQEAKIYTIYQNKKEMNENNLAYNKNLLEKLGFGKTLHDPLEKFVIQQQPEIKLTMEASHFKDNVEYALHFRKSDSTDMYFFNRYEATLKSNAEAFNRTQSFQIRNGNNITAQESFNLVSGRAVNKELFTANGDRYEAWLKLDFSQKDKYGNYEVQQFHQNYGYDLNKALDKFPIKELADADQKAQLLASLKKGNMQQVTIEKDGNEVKMYVEANPRFRTLNIKDELGNTVKRDKVEKKDLSQSNKLDEALAKGKTQSQKQGKSKGVSVS